MQYIHPVSPPSFGTLLAIPFVFLGFFYREQTAKLQESSTGGVICFTIARARNIKCLGYARLSPLPHVSILRLTTQT